MVKEDALKRTDLIDESKSNFFCASARAAARPPSPPPTIIIFDRIILFMTISFYIVIPALQNYVCLILTYNECLETCFLSFSLS